MKEKYLLLYKIYFIIDNINKEVKIREKLNGDWGLGIGDWGLGVGGPPP